MVLLSVNVWLARLRYAITIVYAPVDVLWADTNSESMRLLRDWRIASRSNILHRTDRIAGRFWRSLFASQPCRGWRRHSTLTVRPGPRRVSLRRLMGGCLGNCSLGLPLLQCGSARRVEPAEISRRGGRKRDRVCRPRFACADDAPTIAYDSVPDPLRLPPDLYFGEVSGVALNSKGHVFALSRRATRPGPPTAPRRLSCSNSAPTGDFCARSAITSTPGRSRIP